MLPTSFHDVTSLMEIDVETWRALIAAAHESARLDGAVLNHDALWHSLTTTTPGPDLLDALEAIQELGTDQGRDLLSNAADDQQVPLGPIDDVPARELAARVWTASRTDEALAQVLVRARVSVVEAGRGRTYREFVGRPTKLRTLDQQRVLDAVAQWCREQKKSEAIRVYAYERDGEWRCEVMRGDSVRRVVEIKDRRPEILNFRPAVADHLRYEPATGRLGIATRSPRLVQMYRELLGSMLATDPAFFSNENICTLRPLQQQGRSLFEQHRVPGIVRVDVVELRWRRGDRDKVWVTGPDCFKILDDLQARVQVEGELVQAKLLVWFAGAGRRGQVTITVPGRIEINAGAREHLVERLLDELGLRGTFGPDSERLDLWSLHPWRQREDLWRRHLGAEAFDRLLRDTALRPVRLEAVPHPDHPGLEGALATEDLDGSATIGVSDDPAIAVRTLTSSDVMGYELDVSRVATDIARALGVEEATREITSGIWLLGQRTLAAGATVAVCLATRQPLDTAAHSVRAASNGARPVLLVPTGRVAEGDVTQLECRVPQGPYDSLLGRIVERLNLQDQVSPAIYRTEDLILDPKKGVAWYRGVPLTKLLPETQFFRFAERVARARGALVTKEDLREYLSPKNPDESIVRKAKADFVKRVEESFAAANMECPAEVKEIFKSQSGGYILKATAHILS
jgi:hypothetical protein